MDQPADPIIERMARLDPAVSYSPPAEGSSRYERILERTMQTVTTPVASTTPTPRRRRPRFVAVAAAAGAITIVGITVLRPGHEPSASAAIAEAADGTERLVSFRGELTRGYPDPQILDTSTILVNGDDVRVDTTFVTNGVEEQSTLALVDGVFYEGYAGEVISRIPGPNDSLADFGDASAAVVRAASTSADVEDMGEDAVRSGSATHYRITLDEGSRDALARLTANELAWFELEYPQDVSVIDVWVADERIVKIRVQEQDRTDDIEFFDFDADITVTPPQ